MFLLSNVLRAFLKSSSNTGYGRVRVAPVYSVKIPDFSACAHGMNCYIEGLGWTDPLLHNLLVWISKTLVCDWCACVSERVALCVLSFPRSVSPFPSSPSLFSFTHPCTPPPFGLPHPHLNTDHFIPRSLGTDGAWSEYRPAWEIKKGSPSSVCIDHSSRWDNWDNTRPVYMTCMLLLSQFRVSSAAFLIALLIDPTVCFSLISQHI